MNEVLDYVAQKGWQLKQRGDWLRGECPLCHSKSREPFAIRVSTGQAKCQHCSWSGGLTLLRRELNDDKPKVVRLHPLPGNRAAKLPADLGERVMACHKALLANADVLTKYCGQRKLTEATVMKAHIGIIESRLILPRELHDKPAAKGFHFVVPTFDANGNLLSVKYKKKLLDGGKDIRRAPGGENCFYGLQWLSRDHGSTVVIVEGEEDDLVLDQWGVPNVLSVPNGGGLSSASAESMSWLDAIEGYDDVVLCCDDDETGRKCQAVLTERIGADRIRIVKYPKLEPAFTVVKDATDYARAGKLEELVKAIEEAEPIPNKSVGSLADHIAELQMRMDEGDLVLHRTGFSALDRLMTGVRVGDVIMISGKTESGKSAFVRNLAMQFAAGDLDREPMPVLWASFENTLEECAEAVVQRTANKSIYPDEFSAGAGRVATREEFDEACHQAMRLPISTVEQYGRMDLEQFFNCVKYARRRHDCQIVILDHLHFMLSPKKGMGMTELLDDAMLQIKSIAIALKVVIFVVAHITKLKGDQEATMDDLRGSSSLYQVPNTVIFARRNTDAFYEDDPETGRVTLDIQKMRSTWGRKGQVDLLFDKISGALYEAEGPRPNVFFVGEDPMEVDEQYAAF